MQPYVYRPELRQKLVLPADHSNLLDALTGDMDVLMDDIVGGKSGGSIIICQGRAGTGKTLTAEIYAEIVERPLYRVHSGQLGINAETVEAELKAALDRTKRWGALLLIDEADVFLMERGESLERNAVVGVFLRVLEYCDGLIFLTTNRLDIIDDAILSRCIAQIKYDAPDEENRALLWHTLGDVYGMEIVKPAPQHKPVVIGNLAVNPMCIRLAKEFTNATGRDIKGLIRLSIKYSRQRGFEPSFGSVQRMAIFRGFTCASPLEKEEDKPYKENAKAKTIIRRRLVVK